jgi:hypothetical protein
MGRFWVARNASTNAAQGIDGVLFDVNKNHVSDLRDKPVRKRWREPPPVLAAAIPNG